MSKWLAFLCVLLFVSSTSAFEPVTAQPSPYVVDGLALGGQVRFESQAYKQYHCTPSDKFPGFTWCHKEKTERTNRGEVTFSNSILHSQDGRAFYVNRYIEPAFFGPNEVRTEIDRLSARFGERAREFRMPQREGLPSAIIAVWGKIELKQLDAADVFTVASGGSHKGLLVSFLGVLQRSAKAGVPVYQLSGGAGYLWAATFNQYGQGVLRFLTIDASQIAPPTVASPSPPNSASPPARNGVTAYAKIGSWSIDYTQINSNLTGCGATASFRDDTKLQFALIQSGASKQWTLFISNPQWNPWLASRAQHRLWLVTTKNYQGTLALSDDKTMLILADTSIDFMNSLADAYSLQIFNDNNQPLTSLDMTDSEAAIKAVANCVREHPPNRAPPPEAETIMSGTAFFVAPHVLLTNNHVVKQCTKTIQVRYSERASYEAKISAQDDTNDLALLYTDMANSSVVSFHLRPRVGDSVAAYGFPYAGVLSSSGNFTLGNITALSGIGDDTRFLQISTPIQPGDSGGPLLDMSGNVVGVIVGQLNALAMMQAGKSVPQNVNFAIQAPIVIHFLSIKGVAPKLDTSSASRTLLPADVHDIATQFTVQIYCPAASPTTETGAPVAAVSEILASKFEAATPPGRKAISHRLSGVAARRLLSGNWQDAAGGDSTGAHDEHGCEVAHSC